MLQLLATRRRMLAGLIAVLAIGSLGIWGCADHPTEYDNPNDGIVTTKTPTALIEAATLMEWIDEGRLNSADPDAPVIRTGFTPIRLPRLVAPPDDPDAIRPSLLRIPLTPAGGSSAGRGRSAA